MGTKMGGGLLGQGDAFHGFGRGEGRGAHDSEG